MKIALLHLDLCKGPQSKNIKMIQEAMKIAAQLGAEWVVTPETALQGYFFYDPEQENVFEVQPEAAVEVLRKTAVDLGLTLFLSCAEKDEADGQCYNSCLVIGNAGQVLGRHRKMHTHGVGAEAWITTGTTVEPIACGEVSAGILICADVWYTEHSETLKHKGADIVIAPAAWPPGPCGPADSWEKSSLASGVPLCICNQTGVHPVIDLTKAESAVVHEGVKSHVYCGEEPAILIFEWDTKTQQLLSKDFEVRFLH